MNLGNLLGWNGPAADFWTAQGIGSGIVLPLLFLAVVLTAIRLLRGPTLPDRVVALDLMGTIGVAIAATYTLVTGQEGFMDVAMVLALLSFLGTVAVAVYLKRSV